ncbi:MAG: FliM/FliN family flagellar motor switch protein [Sphingomonadales bacterium]|nr:FliM/FliN family flagellar motor switch protein [Sphingomonadales bacterium]
MSIDTGKKAAIGSHTAIKFREIADGIWLECDDSATDQLISASLDYTVTLSKTTADDRQLLEQFANNLVQDLGEHIAGLVKLNASDIQAMTMHNIADGYCARIELGKSGQTLKLVLSAPILTAIRRCQCPVFERSEQPDRLRIADVVANVKIDFDALLGTAHLSAADVRIIEKGDIIVLDRKSNAPVQLADRRGQIIGYAKLQQEGESLVLSALISGG